MKQSSLGATIRELRKKNNMTQAGLADILGVTDKAVSKWERDLSYPDIVLFPKLADVLGTTIDSLLCECGEECRRTDLLTLFEMSRDIRLPLHIILGYTEIIRYNHDDPEKLQRYLDGIRLSGEYMMKLLDQIRNEIPVKSLDLEKYIQERMSSDVMQLDMFSFSGKRVLVAEDMAVNREIAAEILKQTGAEAEFAEDGLVCLRMIEEAPADYYDLIMMDIMMPNMDGIETTRMIRRLSDPVKAKIPIIAMTTKVSDKDKEAAIAAGMDAFEEKPLFIDKLFETMKQFLYK